MANYYVDNVAGSDGNAGTSEGAAKATIAAGLALLSTGGGDTLYIQATGTNYTITSTMTPPTNASTNPVNIIEGYTTTPGARDGRPTITTSTNSVGIFSGGSGRDAYKFNHLKMTCTASTKGDAINPNGGYTWMLFDCILDGWNIGFNFGSYLYHSVHRTSFLNCTDAIYGSRGDLKIGDCYFYNCTTGIRSDRDATFTVESCSFASGNYGVKMVHLNSEPQFLYLANCSFCNQASAAVYINANLGTSIFQRKNNVFWGSNRYAVELNGLYFSSYSPYGYYNAYGDNTSGNTTSGGTPELSGETITLTVDPYQSSSTGDLRLNNTAGGGALLRALGFPGTYPGQSWAGYRDVGASQHQDSASGGGGFRLDTRGGFQN